MSLRNEIWEKIKEDKSEIYGQTMLDVFLQITNKLELHHYLELSESQKKLIKSPELAYNLAIGIFLDFSKTDPTLEKIISQSAHESYKYAVNTARRFKLGEPVISREPGNAFYYARDIIDGKWEMGEPAISKDSYHSLNYAFYVLKSRFKLGEPAILSSNYAYQYREQFPDVEDDPPPDWDELD
jgi:hypothetical protein